MNEFESYGCCSQLERQDIWIILKLDIISHFALFEPSPHCADE